MNGVRFEHHTRRFHVALAAAVCIVALATSGGNWPIAIVSVAAGFAVGRALGASEWMRLRRQIDRRNVAVTYLEDSAYFAVLTLVAVAALTPGPLIRAGLVTALCPGLVASLLTAAASACVGWAFALYRRIKAYELSAGPLRLRTFYARSILGPEALIGSHATVVDACAPDGRVSTGAEVWFARSIAPAPLVPGSRVVIRDIEGLRLVVDREDALSGEGGPRVA